MADLPLTTDLTDLPIGTLLRKRNGQVCKMVAITSNHPDAPIVLDNGCCVAINGKANNWPVNDIIGIAAWPLLYLNFPSHDQSSFFRYTRSTLAQH